MITVDPRSAVPPFEQLRVQLLEQISSGELAQGARLPTVRRLAEDLGLAPNTVARTYRELEADGAIETRGRHGSFVTTGGDAAEQQGRRAATEFAERIHQLKLPVDQALAWAAAALER
jgi:DNA-binding transcriptional regulator YhcF (GntR family)